MISVSYKAYPHTSSFVNFKVIKENNAKKEHHEDGEEAYYNSELPYKLVPKLKLQMQFVW